MKAPPGLLPLPHEEVSSAVAAELWYQDRVRYVAQVWDQTALQKWIVENCQPPAQAITAAKPEPKKAVAAATQALPPVAEPSTSRKQNSAAKPAGAQELAVAESLPPVSEPKGVTSNLAAQRASTTPRQPPPSTLYVFTCPGSIEPSAPPTPTDRRGGGGSVSGSTPAQTLPEPALPKPVTVAVDKSWLRMLWQMEGEGAVRQLESTLCDRQAPLNVSKSNVTVFPPME